MGQLKRRITWEDAEEFVNSLGYKLLDLYVRRYSRVVIQDGDGYKYNVVIANLKNGRTPTLANPQNPYSLENIQLWLENNDKTFYLCDDNAYEGGTHKKLKFHCNICDEDFLMSWGNVSRGHSCAICVGRQVGEKTSLEFLRPDLAEQWSDRNKLQPNEVTVSSGKKAWWICSECGHEWKATIAKRSIGRSCPSCALKQTESKVANKLKDYCIENFGAIPEYKELRNPETGYWLPYDIYIPSHEIYIEVHGEQHYEYTERFFKTHAKFEYRQHLDRLKQEWAEENGRFIEIDIRKYDTPEKAIEFLLNELNT